MAVDDSRHEETDLNATENTNLVRGHNLTFTMDLDTVTFKSISGYRDLDSFASQLFGNQETYSTGGVTQDQFSQEFQVIGDAFDSRLEYLAGLYYFTESATNEVFYEQAITGTPIGDVTLRDVNNVDATTTSYAIFGQATYTPAILDDALRLTVGLRQTWDEREAEKNFIQTGVYDGNGACVTTCQANELQQGKDNFQKFSPSFTADYAINDEINVYGKVATGYRAGGYNSRGSFENFANGFEPENMLSYELGMKSDLLDRRMRLNVAAFYNDITDMLVNDGTNTAYFSQTDTFNAGQATIAGFEIDSTFLLSEGLTANVGYTYLDANIEEMIIDGVDQADINEMANAPEHAGNLALDYMFPAMQYGQVAVNVSYAYQGETYSSNIPGSLNDDYGLLSARVSLLDIPVSQGTVRAAVWGKNLADEEYTTLMTPRGGQNLAMFGEPRTFGVDVTYEY
ncbi:hypothetical protein SIN8267_01904 [Sinobacterium norvegicum]|uniref:TonB-dependent receptor-like beta-barrel domain-containing protein n=1 Tax=Sinobacterium norvegicum TaxID=1641715 RepID=A0ABM9AFI2_9GAMM|nr:TonB-dependent receptor [Sinobacterium norvegicum]CAH0991789.1 hypothetical protein SIN8267_01904 [Sinobacterium norvegicum]